MSLADLWFVLFVAIIGGYIVLDGFDLGVGMLHPFAAKEDRERRIQEAAAHAALALLREQLGVEGCVRVYEG